MSRVPTKNIDYTSRDYEGFREVILKQLDTKMPEYTDRSETDAGIVIIEGLANGLDIVSMYSDLVVNDLLLATTQDRGFALLLAKCLGYSPYNQIASEYEQIFVLDEPQEEDVIIPKGTSLTTVESSDLETLTFETLDELVIPSGKLGDEKNLQGEYLYTVRVQQGETINQDILGGSNGTPSQSFQLNYTNALVETLQVFVNDGATVQAWTRVSSFLECDENSKVFMVYVDDFDVCTVLFGNGLKGQIPPVYSGGISATYRVGGGEISNIPLNVLTEIEDSLPFVDSTSNVKIIKKGHDKEILESIKENAPASYRVRNRLVTLEDYSDSLRINFYDFLRLKTVRDNADKRKAIIYYMMREGYTLTPKLIEDVTKYIAKRSMIGTSFELISYEPQVVDITGKLIINKDYNETQILSDVKEYLQKVIFKFGELQFEDSLVKSDVENEIKNMFDGILSFRISLPDSDIISPNAPKNVLTLGSMNITVQKI